MFYMHQCQGCIQDFFFLGGREGGGGIGRGGMTYFVHVHVHTRRCHAYTSKYIIE